MCSLRAQPAFRNRMRAHGKKLHGLALSKGCASASRREGVDAPYRETAGIANDGKACEMLSPTPPERGEGVSRAARGETSTEIAATPPRIRRHSRHRRGTRLLPEAGRTAPRMHRYNPLNFASVVRRAALIHYSYTGRYSI